MSGILFAINEQITMVVIHPSNIYNTKNNKNLKKCIKNTNFLEYSLKNNII